MYASDLGDHIGMESCIDLDSTDHTYTAPLNNRKPWGLNNRKSSSMFSSSVKELPPPLPIHTSTVLKRYYTDDGRLIIAEEKIDCPKCHFTANRSNGRLTLQLVPSSESSCDAEIGGEKTNIIMKDDDDDDDGDGGVGKCFKYNGAVRVTAAGGPCLLVEQNQLHAIRPVEI